MTVIIKVEKNCPSCNVLRSIQTDNKAGMDYKAVVSYMVSELEVRLQRHIDNNCDKEKS